jgi:RNase P/RNase MRP subunit p30
VRNIYGLDFRWQVEYEMMRARMVKLELPDNSIYDEIFQEMGSRRLNFLLNMYNTIIQKCLS